jgi:nucleotide-binding universal stress UspA family protein
MQKLINTDRGPSPKRETDTRLMIVVEESSASKRAIEYVGRIVSRHRGFHVCLVHSMPSLPPELLEFGGAENPAEEMELDRDLKLSQRQWISKAKQKAERALHQASAILVKAGLAAGSLNEELLDPQDKRNTVDEILQLARTCGCTTIVVGRQSLSWLQALVRGDVAEKLVHRAKGLTVWVVE